MKISENIISQWPKFEDEVIYLIELKTWSRRPHDGVWFYSTMPILLSWNDREKAFNSRDGLIALSRVVAVYELKMDPKYQWNTSGDPNLKEWPE